MVKDMDGEEKRIGAKKRLKAFEMGLDSDGDEPIGSLIKLKSRKNPRKLKPLSSGDKGTDIEVRAEVSNCEKGTDFEVRAEELLADKLDSGGLEDTLAIFRKKLKAPKKDSGFRVTVDKGGHARSDLITGKGLENKGKLEIKGLSSALDTNDLSDLVETRAVSAGVMSLHNSSGKYDKGIEISSNHSSGDNVEDSLSALFKKVHSGSVKKSRPSSGSKLRRDAATAADEPCPSLDGITNDSRSVVTEKTCVSTKLSGKRQNKEASWSPRVETSSIFAQYKSGVNLDLDSEAAQLPGGAQASNTIQEAGIACLFANEDTIFGNDIHNETSLDVLAPVSQGESSRKAAEPSLGGPSQNSSHELIHEDPGKSPCVGSKTKHSLTQMIKLQNGLRDSLSTDENSKQKDVPCPKTALELIGDQSEFAKDGSCTKSSDTLAQHSKDLSSYHLPGDDKESCIMIEKQNTATCLNDAQFLDKSSSDVSRLNKNELPRGKLKPSSFGFDSVKREEPLAHAVTNPDATMVMSYTNFSAVEEANGCSSHSITPEQVDVFQEDARCLREIKQKKNNLSAVQRVVRKAKKRRHGDMAYEGDVDWDVLVHEQGYADVPFRTREKSDSMANVDSEIEAGGAAAVSAGLRGHSVGPLENIRFKDVLRRKGGLQEYLKCRNKILSLWNKDVTRILPLIECGVTETPSDDESPRISLIRDIFLFLDQSGYINAGIATKKEKAETSSMHNYKLLGEKKFEGQLGASFTDSADGVSFILGRVNSSGTYTEMKDGVLIDDGNQMEAAKGDIQKANDISMPKVLDDGPETVECDNFDVNTKTVASEETDNLLTNMAVNKVDNDTGSLVPKSMNELSNVPLTASDHVETFETVQSGKIKRIIVIGAGPAGLTAARHLQRQGFSVTVLEARSRIGGRVFTDTSSLSVPVDLGASIITGVEADVGTDRRPDPSSLVCAQLGLELTVLNSDCPLYDTVTCEKVPGALDEALEAEFNGLLDDMVLVVAEKGEQAMKMSLEDGLEYALKRRCQVRDGTNHIGPNYCHQLGVPLKSDECSGLCDVYEISDGADKILSPLERRVMDWHFAHLEYGCAAMLNDVSLPYWNQDDVYGGFGGAHCMIKGGYGAVVKSLAQGLSIHLSQVVTEVSYCKGFSRAENREVRVSTSNGDEFSGDAVLITVPLGCLKADSIKFSPPLPQWKDLSIQRLGFGVLNKVVLEFPKVFWDDAVDYFGATAEDTVQRGHCFMFWNVKKTVGAPVLIALVVGKAAIDGEKMSSSDHVDHALTVLRKLFGEEAVPDPIASVVTDWGRDPFSYGAYSYVAIGASGEDYDMLGRPVEDCLFFAGEATCKEHPDTVGGAMMSGLREAVRIIDILKTGNDYMAEVEAIEAAERQSNGERNEVKDIAKRLDALDFYKSSSDKSLISMRENLLGSLFSTAKTSAGRLRLAKELLNLSVESLKSFAGTQEGLSVLNSWILDSLGKDGTQLLRHCVRLLTLVSTDLLAVRLSGIGKTVKEKVCVHTSRDIRGIAGQLVNMWIEVFRKEKTSNRGFKLLRHMSGSETTKNKGKHITSGRPPVHAHHVAGDKMNGKQVKLDGVTGSKSDIYSSVSISKGGQSGKSEVADNVVLSEEELAAIAAADAARAQAQAAREAYEALEARRNKSLLLPKIPSFQKFARREMDDPELRRRCADGAQENQDCIAEIDSRNCRVREWSVDFSAACANLDSSRVSVDNLSQRSHSNDMACQGNLGEHSGESVAVESCAFTKAWVDSAGSVGLKDYHDIERWQSQAAAAESEYNSSRHVRDEEDSTTSRLPAKDDSKQWNEGSVSHVTVNKELAVNPPRGPEHIKHAVVDYVASLLMPLYKAKKIDRDGYKSIMKKTATKVMEQTSDVEKKMTVPKFLDLKRKNKIRAFVDKLIERHMAMNPVMKS